VEVDPLNPIASSYYDRTYQQLIDAPDHEGWKWLQERVEKVSHYIVGDSILDLGCGLARIAERFPDVSYTGIDYSPVAIEWSRDNCSTENTLYVCSGIIEWLVGQRDNYDTVLLLEILEHVKTPGLIVAEALMRTAKRLIVTVPRDMPGRSHITPVWTEEMLLELLGEKAWVYCHLFGGPDNDRWWIAVKDIE
jgi:2-polyprenyl-3-methyl-5-hydroxy-6-metoxy-1,4-benzoquinol methylase